MFRKHYMDLLRNKPMSLTQIARATGEPLKDVANDLEHLLQSLKHTDFKAVVTPAECRKCGFEFSAERLKRPSKCPECRSTWIYEPLVAIEPKTPAGTLA